MVVLAPLLAVGGEYAVATSTAYGLLATISCLPGLGVLLVTWWRSGPVSSRATP